MNTEPRRDAATFDLERSGLPVALDRLLDAHPEIPAVLLVTGAGARQDGSGARAALALAGRMAEAGRRVVLGDLAVDVPALHEAAGVPNLEGMTDLFLFGASLRRVARQLPGSGLHLVTAGPVVADPMELTEHPRWDALLSGLARARAVLLVVVPADVAGLDRLVSRVPHAVVLARADEAESAVTALPAGCEVIGTLVTASGPAPRVERAEDHPAPPVEASAPPVGATEPPVEASAPPVGATEPEAAPEMVASPDSEPQDVASLGEPVFARRSHKRSKRRRISPILWIALVATALFAAWWWVRELIPASFDAGVTADVAEGGVEAAPERADVPLPYSVAVEAHQSLDAAMERIGRLSRADADVRFQVVPVAVAGRVWYRILAGPLADSVTAGELAARLVRSGLADDAGGWMVRHTPWAFDLGEFDDSDAASAARLANRARGVPAYVVDIPYSSGPPRYRLYAGAYASPTEAEVLSRFLSDAGIQAPLRSRAGRPIP